jgi:predicted HTH domain antitoxin
METLEVKVSFPKSVLAAAGVQEQELDELIRESLAIDLYRRGLLSLGKAAELAGVATKWEMMTVLAKHDVWVDYTADDAVKDADALAQTGKG